MSGHVAADANAIDGDQPRASGRPAGLAAIDAAIFSNDPRRRIRLQQWVVSALAYVASGLVLWFGLRLGWMDATRLLPWCAVLATGQTAIYAALRSGWSERCTDPALTVVQLLLGVAGVDWAYLICGPVRSVTLFPLLLIFTFAAFSLTWRRIAMLTLLALASLLATMLALHAIRPGGGSWSLHDADLRLDLINFLVISIMLPALSSLAGRLSSLRTKLRSQRAALTEALREVQRLATHDALTGLCNRRYMEQRLGEEQLRSERQSQTFSVALVDLDHFKRINDALGHAGGDRVLQEFAREAERGLRGFDCVARWGGEEFLVLMPAAVAAQASDSMLRLLQQVRAMPRHDGDPPLSFSAGIAEHRQGESIAHLVARADKAMYAAKDAGRGQICID